LLAIAAVGPAAAQTVDDVNWINKCIADISGRESMD
jgi:hypothetical protein